MTPALKTKLETAHLEYSRGQRSFVELVEVINEIKKEDRAVCPHEAKRLSDKGVFCFDCDAKLEWDPEYFGYLEVGA